MKTAQFIEETKAAQSPENTESSPKKKRGDAARIAAWQWKPGQSGNPGGRPKVDVSREIAKAIFENNPEAAYEALAGALLKGNAYVFKELADRAYGKIADKTELTGKDGAPIEFQGVNDQQLDEQIRELRQKLGASPVAGVGSSGSGEGAASEPPKAK